MANNIDRSRILGVATYYKTKALKLCPSEYVVTQVEDCILAAKKLGLEYKKTNNKKNLPTGCNWSGEKVYLNQNDNKLLKEELVSKIYTVPEKKIIAMHDIDMTESYLIYIDKIENVTIDEKSDIYDKYLRLSRSKISNELFNTYDAHIRKKYKVDINYKTLNTVKNYFN